MRRLFCVLTAVFLCVSLAISVSAATGASSVTGYATVEQGGGCQVSLTINLHLEEATTGLTFPVPGEASGVLLNGARVSTTRSGGVRQVNLNRVTRNVVGDVTVNIQYSLRDVIHAAEDGTYQLRLPLLSGFQYPIEHMEFSVTMPAPLQIRPGFQSGYHQSSIEEYLQYDISGPTVTGKTLQALKDHETLSMTMQVDETMFPRSFAQTRDYTWSEMAMAVCGILAILYWIVTMWNRPGFAKLQAEPPQGFSAGALGNLLTLGGMDMTMMVLSWAQLGYILIHIKGNRVILHKRMDMGNERSELEVRYFRKLFSKGNRVDTWEARYAQLCLTAAKSTEGNRELLKPFNGNSKIFRGLAAAAGMFGGVSMAVALAEGAALQGLLMVLFGALGLWSGWQLTDWGIALFLLHRDKLKKCMIHSALWLLLGLVAGAVELALWMVGGLLVLGILLAWGGRRTAVGRLCQMQTVGFARYLRTVREAQLRRICSSDPEYFFRLAPAAFALGLEKTFARHFGGMRLDRCPYLTTGMDGHMTALQWTSLMRRAVDGMNSRANRLGFEKTVRLIRSIIKY